MMNAHGSFHLNGDNLDRFATQFFDWLKSLDAEVTSSNFNFYCNEEKKKEAEKKLQPAAVKNAS